MERDDWHGEVIVRRNGCQLCQKADRFAAATTRWMMRTHGVCKVEPPTRPSCYSDVAPRAWIGASAKISQMKFNVLKAVKTNQVAGF